MINHLQARILPNIDIKHILMLSAGFMVLTFASQLSIPLNPVPLTFQSTTVILLGFAFGPRLGTQIVIAYLLAGALGLPVFANFQGGITELFSPRGGYIAGFLPAVMLSGYLANRGMTTSFLRSLLAATVSDAVIFLFGLCWLASFIGWQTAFMVGFVPFIISEIVKLVALSCVTPVLHK